MQLLKKVNKVYLCPIQKVVKVNQIQYQIIFNYRFWKKVKISQINVLPFLNELD
jgi:hypothetical protein